MIGARSVVKPLACRRARCSALGLTARRGQAKWLTVPLVLRFDAHKRKATFTEISYTKLRTFSQDVTGPTMSCRDEA